MTFKRAIWYPIAVGLTVINVVGAWFATQPWHSGSHAVLALAFGLWAQRLRQSPGGSEPLPDQDRFEALEADMNRMRQELSETQERLDFAERLLAQAREAGRVGPQR